MTAEGRAARAVARLIDGDLSEDVREDLIRELADHPETVAEVIRGLIRQGPVEDGAQSGLIAITEAGKRHVESDFGRDRRPWN